MTSKAERRSRAFGVGLPTPLDLIHSTKVPNPMPEPLSGRLGCFFCTGVFGRLLAQKALRLKPEIEAQMRVHYDAIVALVPNGHWVHLTVGPFGRPDAKSTE